MNNVLKNYLRFVSVFILCGMLYKGLAAEDSLIGLWRFNKGSGTVAEDESGNNNDGTLINMSGGGWVSGKSGGYALDFDGTDDYVNCGSDSSLNPTDSITIAAWIKLDGSYECDNTIVSKGYATDAGEIYWLVIRATSPHRLMFSWGDGTTRDWLHSTTGISSNEWHHVAATFDSGEVKIYIDGELDASKTSSVTSIQQQAYDTQIGKYWTTGHYFDGTIEDVRMYNYVLNEDVIRNYYDELCGCWEMNEGTGTTITDSSGNDNTGTLTNMSSPWVSGHLDKDGYFRNALQFDGADDYINCGNDSSLNPSDALTITAWIKLDGSFTYDNTIVSRGYATDSGEVYWLEILNYSPYQVRFHWGDGTTRDYLKTTSGIPSNEWHHVAVTFDSGEVKIYIDGELDASKTSTVTSIQLQAYDTQIGKYWSGAVAHLFDGAMDKVKIYRRVLSANEIRAMNLLSAFPNCNYYTGETGTAVSTLDITSDTGLSGCYLIAKDSSGTALGSSASAGIETDVPFSTSSLTNGSASTVTVELRNDSGILVMNTPIEVMKCTANTGNEVKIDQKNGIVLRNGSGFFPIGIYMYGINSDDTSEFQRIANAGFNSVIRWNLYVDSTDATTYLETADDYGLLVVDRHEAYSTVILKQYNSSSQSFWDAYWGLGEDPIDVDQNERIIDAVSYAKLEQNLLGYYTFDEPAETQLDVGQYLYSNTNDEDGYHPTILTYMCDVGVPEGEYYTNWCDIISLDPYWIPPFVSGNWQTSVNWVAKWIIHGKERTWQDLKALWITALAEYFGNSHKRAITENEQFCQTYLALIHGAKGLFYFRYPVLHESSWTALENIAEELNTLSPIMLTPDLEQEIDYEETFDPANDDFVDVQVCLRKAPAGENYDYVLLAANTQPYSVDVDYTISLLGSSGTVNRLFSENTYSITNGNFSDTLEAYATRAYTFTSASTASITIDVDMPLGTPPSPEEVHPKTGRDGKTNLMQNPSLEDTTLAKWPDYCWPLYAEPMINTQNQGWGLETDNPYHSNNCLKIIRSGSTNGIYFHLSPQHTNQTPQNYTFSVYLKANVAGTRVQLGSTALDENETKTLSTSWERKEVTFSIPANFSLYNNFYIWVIDDGTVWVDAIQVEQGSSATAFTTD